MVWVFTVIGKKGAAVMATFGHILCRWVEYNWWVRGIGVGTQWRVAGDRHVA